MGLGIRVFFIKDDDSLKRIPLAQYERLMRGDPGIRFKEYAGQMIRYVLMVLEYENRKPVDVLRAEYSFVKFNPDGKLDHKMLEELKRLGADMLPPVEKDRSKPNLINAQSLFAKKRFQEKYTWEPTPEIQAELAKSIFGKTLK
jgi:hypothetical protein